MLASILPLSAVPDSAPTTWAEPESIVPGSKTECRPLVLETRDASAILLQIGFMSLSKEVYVPGLYLRVCPNT